MPLFIEMGINRRTKKVNRYYINWNNFRNWHYQVCNNLKRKYKEIAALKLEGISFQTKIKMAFVLHKGDKRKVDRSNILGLHEKFFCDALTECGCIVDDNDNYLESTTYRTGEIDKEDPRVDIIIEEIA